MFRHALVLAIVQTGSLTRGAQASSLPPWAAAIAESAPPVTTGDTDTRFLLSKTRVEVQSNGSLLVRRWLAIQALRNEVTTLVTGYGFGEDSRVRHSKAWHLPPHGKADRTHEGAIDLGADDSYLTDRKIRAIPVTGIQKGSLAFFEFEALESPATLGYEQRFYEGAPIDVARFELALPPAWKLHCDWLRGEGPTPVVDGSVTAWELHGLPGGGKDLPLGESDADRAPRLVLAFSPPDNSSLHGVAVIDTWARFGQWYDALMKGREAATPQVADVARAATARVGDDWFQKVRATALYVRDQVRYLDRELGIGGFQPHPAAQVLHEKIGDCKDKGTLFRAMLAAEGIHAQALLVNASVDRSVSDDVPSPGAFNHFIVGIPVPGDKPVPADMQSAIVPLDDGGGLLVIDTTDELAPIGFVSASVAGKRALLVDGSKSRLITLPESSGHRIERTLSTELLQDGTLELHASVRAFGDPAADRRAAWRASRERFMKQDEVVLAHRWPGARIVEHNASEDGSDGTFLETIVWQVPSWSGSVPLFSESLDDLPRAPLNDRDVAVVYPFPMTLRCESTLHGFPSDVALPMARNGHGDGWSVRTTVDRQEATVHASLELVLEKRRFESKEFDELRRFWDAARQAASGVLQPR